MNIKRIMSLFTTVVMTMAFVNAQNVIDLQGRWQLSAVENSVQSVEHNAPDDDYKGTVTLPGSMLTNEKGDNVSLDTRWTGSIYDSSFYFNPYMAKYRVEGNMKFPFFLTPNKHYIGHAIYTKKVTIPSSWKGRRVILYLERPHIETSVRVNQKDAGHRMSLSVPHEYDITNLVQCGTHNVIEIDVYNGIENVCVGQDSHSVTDQTQGNWNGIAGKIELHSLAKSYISNVRTEPDVKNKSVKISVRAHLEESKIKQKNCKVNIDLFNSQYEMKTKSAALSFSGIKDNLYEGTTVISLGKDCYLWDEYEPNLYRVTVILDGDTLKSQFGMRELSTNGRTIKINGRDLILRGTVENCCFPLTGYPPTDTETWLSIYRKCKEYGLNSMRFHSYCPPQAAFDAADIIGFYLQPEGPSWPNHGVKLGKGMPIDKYLLDETIKADSAYGNHPSFCFLAAGNEPAGDWVKWGQDFIAYWKKHDKRHLYTTASVGGGWAWTPYDQYRVKGGARGLDWVRRAPQSTDDFYESITKVPARILPKGSPQVSINEPFVSHETGQWCVFPDLKETSQYRGVYKAYNFDIFRDLLDKNGMSSQAEKFLKSSGKLQTLCYKYDLERFFRTPDYAGFQILSLNDYSGQGTALVGPLNVFWKEKGYCDAIEWTEFCAPIVLLAEFPKFTYSTNENLDVAVKLCNNATSLNNARLKLCVEDEQGDILFEEETGIYSGVEQRIDLVHCSPVANIKFPLSNITRPSKLTLRAIISAQGGEELYKYQSAAAKKYQEIYKKDEESNSVIMSVNHWDFWTYPSLPIAEDKADTKKYGVYITDTMDEKAEEELAKGGKVLLLAAGKITYGSDVVQHYLPVFWNTSWFKMRPPHTTGAYIQTTHPIYDDFPTDDWTNLNWWELVNKAQVINLAKFPSSYQPPMQPIDTWHVGRKLAMVVEANVEGGKLLMTTFDISNDLDKRIVARQMRESILKYMSSEKFKPSIKVELNTIKALFTENAPKVDMFTKDSPDELKPKIQ